MTDQISDINVVAQDLLPTPDQLRSDLILSKTAERTVLQGRGVMRRILDREDSRLSIIVGPCSIHDVEAAHDYAHKLKALATEVEDRLFLIMRVYFEKPRTTVGWKGFINDPDMDDSFRIEKGLYQARKLLLHLAEIGLPTATEALDPIMPQYLSDLISWTAIGARTVESQTHREMASGLSSPVGFKNGTDGTLEVAINALQSVTRPHHFLGINQSGQTTVFRTRGNRYAHIVLRGGGGRHNYDSISVAKCEQELERAGLSSNIMVDCSHGNSNKNPALQPSVAKDCVHQIVEGNRSIIGLMLESNLNAGNQTIPKDLSKLQYGVSVTDGCIDWPTTEALLRELADTLRK
jgi:3-deoxy-7-phosphoheptulonate synthase